MKPAPTQVPPGVARFDANVLPKIALADTTVWLRALGWADDDHRVCRDFVNAMLHHGRTVLMATPTVVELIRGDATRKIPNVRGIVNVAFGLDAAMEAAKWAPSSWISQTPEGERAVLKYDVLIVACAKVSGSAHVVALDGRSTMRRATDAAKVELVRPDAFLLPLERQLLETQRKAAP